MIKKILLLSLFCLINLFAQDGGKISGLVYADYFYNVARDTGFVPDRVLSGEKDFQGFSFRRIYLTYDYKISEKFDTRVRLEGHDGANLPNGNFSVLLKDVWLRWKNIFDGHDIIFGLQNTPAFEVSESFWRYRSIEKTIMDLRGAVSSRDFGIALKGKIDKNKIFNYWLLIANNSNISPETDKYKRFYGHLHINSSENISATLYADFKAKPDKINPLNTSDMVGANDITYGGFLGYMEKNRYSVGVEGFLTSAENALTVMKNGSIGLENQVKLGISLFGSYDFTKTFGVLGRYDFYDPNTNTSVKGDAMNFIILGLSFSPDPMVQIIPNIELETYEKTADNRSIDASLTARVTLYYRFL